MNYSSHGHAFTAEDWTAMTDFLDHHLRAKETKRKFDLPVPKPE